jgi:hypothetical protein
MRTRFLRHLPAAAALAMASLAAAACSSPAVQALPTTTPSTAPSATAAATASAGPSTTQPAESTHSPRPGPKPGHTAPGTRCLGAVEYTISASDTGPAWPRLCIAVGGVLRVENLGPDGFTQSPLDKADCNYEAAVRTCRLLYPGIVRFTTDNGRQVRKLTLEIARASSPPKPSPACMSAGTTFTVDANEGGPPWWPICMKVGAVVRVENLGPGALSVAPSNAVSCQYEAAIHRCRLIRAATVVFTIADPDSGADARTLTVVAIR